MSTNINPHSIRYRPADQQLYWATVRYTRHWLLEDGPECCEVIQKKMQPEMLQRIAIRYNVMRGIVGKDKNPHAKQTICDEINNLAEDWPASLLDRANKCKELVVNINKMKSPCFNGFQGSATTKFMWFIKPKNWTIFDRYAADGLGVPGSAESGKRMFDFYQVLHDREIPKTWESMQGLINCRALKGLPAPRIVDSFLMTKGGRGGDDQSIRLAKFSMGLISKEMADNIHNLALEIQEKFSAQLEEKLK